MGAVTLGQVGPPSGGVCEDGADLAQPTVTSGNSYVVPGTGLITSWTTYGGPNAGLPLTLKIFRLVSPPATYEAVAHTGPRAVAANGVAGNTFAASIHVEPGDILGLDGGSHCRLAAPGDRHLSHYPSLADGESASFMTAPDFRLNVQANFVPDNTFSLAQTSRNKKKGTATLLFDLPNPGQLTGSGKGAKVTATSPKPQGTVPAPGAGPSQLVVKAKGKKRARLNDTGKVKLRLTVTYTPTGGDPKTTTLKVKLRKKR
jgi:hypothetical protein